ncbi:hypothetical protein BVY03_05110 [bacterium K02(2017)]|nr:hypothetical protein BVY03_05110 [bacterium K02(2017)]
MTKNNNPAFSYIILILILFVACSSIDQQIKAGIEAYQKDNFHQSFQILKPLADKGEGEAQHYTGLMYLDGMGTEKDLAQGLKWLDLAVKNNQLLAMWKLADIHFNGKGVSKNVSLGISYYKKAAMAGMVKAQILLGTLYLIGDIIPKNLNEAMIYFQLAADQGEAIGQYHMGLLTEKGLTGLTPNIDSAINWYELAAKQEHPESQNRLALIYLKKEKIKTAISWFERSAKSNNAGAQFHLANLHLSGAKFNINDERAFTLMQKSAQNGNLMAMVKLAEIFELGLLSKSKNIKQALKWYVTAAKQKEAKSMGKIAVAMINGQGMTKDIAKGKQLLKLAATAGDKESMSNLANGYQSGLINGKVEIDKAIEWYQKAAKAGHDWAQYRLGVLYSDGKLIKQNINLALRWFKMAADQNHGPSLHQLGIMHLKGIGLPQSHLQAIFWLKLAAQNNHKPAMQILAQAYEKGKLGLIPDEAMAKYWIDKINQL